MQAEKLLNLELAELEHKISIGRYLKITCDTSTYLRKALLIDICEKTTIMSTDIDIIDAIQNLNDTLKNEVSESFFLTGCTIPRSRIESILINGNEIIIETVADSNYNSQLTATLINSNNEAIKEIATGHSLAEVMFKIEYYLSHVYNMAICS